MAALEPVLDHAATERARLVNESRARLLSAGRAVTPPMLARARGAQLDAARQWIRRRHKAGHLVMVVHNNQSYVPTFQLDEAFELRNDAAGIVAQLRNAGMSDWAIWTWFESPSTWLGDETPASALMVGDTEGLQLAVDGLLQQ